MNARPLPAREGETLCIHCFLRFIIRGSAGLLSKMMKEEEEMGDTARGPGNVMIAFLPAGGQPRGHYHWHSVCNG